MGYSKKTTHIKEGLAHLIDQFKRKPDVVKLLTTYLVQIQELEDALAEILTETTIDNSVGAQLDALGSIVGEPRAGRTDLQYRTAIRARIILNQSEGTPEEIIALIRAIAGEVVVELVEDFPASFTATIVDPIDPLLIDTAQIGGLVDSGRLAGVRGITVFATADPFQYDTGLGYDDGKYAGAV